MFYGIAFFLLVPFASVLALCFVLDFHKQMMKENEGTPQMIKIALRCVALRLHLKIQYKNRRPASRTGDSVLCNGLWFSGAECLGYR